MLIDNHPYLFFYLLGSFFAILLILFKVFLFWFIAWITKANIVHKNLRKLMPPEEKSILLKIVIFIGTLLFESLLSWVNVLVASWQIISGGLRIVRELLQPAPEIIKNLRFPLRNNPNMQRESVWAYVQALKIKSGEKQPTKEAILFSLEEIKELYPSFNLVIALKELESLASIENRVTSELLSEIA